MIVLRPPGACQILDDGLTISYESPRVNTERAIRPRLVVIPRRRRGDLDRPLRVCRVRTSTLGTLGSAWWPREVAGRPDRAWSDHPQRRVTSRSRPGVDQVARATVNSSGAMAGRGWLRPVLHSRSLGHVRGTHGRVQYSTELVAPVETRSAENRTRLGHAHPRTRGRVHDSADLVAAVGTRSGGNRARPRVCPGHSIRMPEIARLMTSCWISLVPSKIVWIFASRCQRSTGYSRV
jgi:hypothetical protein